MSDLYNKIENFQIKNPRIPKQEIEDLVKTVAVSCMQSIVSNEEFNGRASGAWWTIRENFEIQVKDQNQMLPINRIAGDEDQSQFSKACNAGDIDGMKAALKKFVHINSDHETSALTNAIVADNLTTLKFFIEDDFINRNPLYKNQVGFDYVKGELFSLAYFYQRKEILEYFICTHNLETTSEARIALKKDNSEFKNEIIEIISKKHAELILDITVDNTPNIKVKQKF